MAIAHMALWVSKKDLTTCMNDKRVVDVSLKGILMYAYKWSSMNPAEVLSATKSCKPECVGSFNMDWQILVFYPEPEARDKIY
jgi:hypothetical protein